MLPRGTAPGDGDFLILTLDRTLVRGRMLVLGSGLTGVDAGPGTTYTLGLTRARVVSTTAVGNIGIGTDTLISVSLPAGALAVNGDSLEIIAWGTFAANANNKTLALLFGGTTLFSTGALPLSGGSWMIRAIVIRTGATTQKAIAWFSGSLNALSAEVNMTTPTETLSGAITIRCTGAATTDDDIRQEVMEVVQR